MHSHCHQIVAELDTSPETAFDILADVTKRPSWDELCAEGRIIEEYTPDTKVQYIRMNPVWPTAARDACTLAHISKLPDGRYINVTKSVAHPNCPENAAQGLVRMEAGIAGQLISPLYDSTGRVVPGKCKVVQIADGDLKGWIPASVIKLGAYLIVIIAESCNRWLLNLAITCRQTLQSQ